MVHTFDHWAVPPREGSDTNRHQLERQSPFHIIRHQMSRRRGEQGCAGGGVKGVTFRPQACSSGHSAALALACALAHTLAVATIAASHLVFWRRRGRQHCPEFPIPGLRRPTLIPRSTPNKAGRRRGQR